MYVRTYVCLYVCMYVSMYDIVNQQNNSQFEFDRK